MALREGECFLVRRVADRGTDKNIGGSCARGEDRRHVRRTADRGNDRVDPDSWDLKIKRLRQRVRDLEEIRRLRQRVRDLEEIKRLRQRVRDLDLQQEMRKTETELSTIVWDEGGDGEQQPFSRHPHRFLEPIYLKSEPEDKPKFDEDGMLPDEEEYYWSQQAVNGTNLEEEEEKDNHKPSKVSPGIFVAISKDDTVANGGATVVTSDTMMVNGGVTGDVETGLKFQINKPTITGNLMVSSANKGSTIKNIEIQMEKDFNLDRLIPVFMDKYALHEMDNLMPPMHEDNTRGRQYANKILHLEMKINSKSVLYEENGFLHGHSGIVGDHTNFSSDKYIDGERAIEGPVNPIDPKEDDPDELFEPVKLNANKSRLDVPYDPGGFEPKAKLEDEFFSKRGSMMQGYLLI
ncbi:hypothetical protein Hdeb2414_s0025g00667421 [Helianthus debilis subsp. tardiflorus]